MRILHTYCMNYNLGDHALGIGVKNILRQCLPVDYIAETNLQGQVFNEYYINVLNKNYDLLVIGGGGIIHGAHWPNGWFWLIEKNDIKKINIPFIVYGAGYNYFKNEGEIPKRAIDHLLETKSRARFFSVRNDGSHDRLQENTGIDAEVIADPGFWVGINRRYSRPIRDKYIVVQLANDKPLHRFGSAERKQEFVEKIRRIIEQLAGRYRVVMAPHVYQDLELCAEAMKGMKGAEIWQFSRYAFDRTHECLGYYKHAEFVLAMRGHGQIVPLGFGVPVISLENHDKNIGMMKDMNLAQYNLNIFDEDLVEKTLRLANYMDGNTELRKVIAHRIHELYIDTKLKFVALGGQLNNV